MHVSRVLIVMCLSVAMLAGCGKQELEEAKARNAELTAQNQQLSGTIARLETEKSSISKELASEKDRNATVADELAQVKKAHADSTKRTEELDKKVGQLDTEILTLKQEKERLSAEVDELRKQAVQPPAQTSILPEERGEMPSTMESPSGSTPQASMTPCKALVEYMRQARSVIQRSKGGERKSKLDELRSGYASKTREAPESARKAADEWVKEMSSSWDNVQDDTLFRILQLKNAAISACGLSPNEAGL